MAGKQLVLECNNREIRLLCEAIRLYTEAAYPPGGSECAQAARETLLDTANAIDEQYAASGQATVSRRLRTQFRAALDYYAQANGIHDTDPRSAGVAVLSALFTGKKQG